MGRITLTDGSGRYFLPAKSQVWKEDTEWNGSNQIGMVTRSQWEHERLFRTAGGKWILEHRSNRQGHMDSYVEIDDAAAARWLSLNGDQPPEIVAKEFAELEIK